MPPFTPDGITIVMVAHGRRNVVRQTLAGLAECVQPSTYEHLVLIENGPECGLDTVVSEFQDRLSIIHNRINSPRKTIALNHALRLIGTGWALFIDDDVRVNPDWITTYAEAFAREPKGLYFGGPTGVDYEQRPAEWLIPFLPESARGLEFPEGTTEIRYPTCFLGFNWAAHIETLMQAGGFPEQFGPGTTFGGGDETLMQLKLRQAGQVGRVLPQAKVWHHVPADRCTAEWTLKRVNASGRVVGIEAFWYERQQPRWFGTLRAHLRHARNRLAYLRLADILSANASGRFSLRSYWAWLSGFSHGFRNANDTDFPSLVASKVHRPMAN